MRDRAREASENDPGIRVQKILAAGGLGSRRACEDLIRAGRVQVDGATVCLGDRADPERARVCVDGVPVPTRGDLVYLLLCKPVGVVTSARDPMGRRTVIDLVGDVGRVFPVGRLDMDTEGLLLLTNDGDLAQLLTHPSHGVAKTYVAEVLGVPGRDALRRLRDGVELEDGRTAPARARLVARKAERAVLELTLHEGRNRQVRRMCEAIGHPVERLVRTRIGPLRDRALRPGDWRPLRASEVRALYEAGTNPGDAGTGH